MATLEIERKWFFDANPCNTILPEIQLKKQRFIYQWYIVATNDAQVRVTRQLEDKGSRYTLNIKNGNGLVRKEVKIDIAYKDFLAMIAQCDGLRPIAKHCYIYNLPDGKKLEIAHVDGSNENWWYAEVEFTSEEESNKFDISKYLTAEAIDRTNDPTYAMKNYWRRTRLNQ